jgi:hypothetical protein
MAYIYKALSKGFIHNSLVNQGDKVTSDVRLNASWLQFIRYDGDEIASDEPVSNNELEPTAGVIGAFAKMFNMR